MDRDRPRRLAARVALAWLLCCATVSGASLADGSAAASPVRNASGYAQTYSTSGFIDTANPFFSSLGPNGRSCASCHVPAENWTITPEGLRARFDATAGTDPVFRPVDGATSPDADVASLEERRRAYALLLAKGLIRIGIPAAAQFELIAVDDPYGHASAKELSLYRRPLPSTNLKFLSTVMWDGRNTLSDPHSLNCIVAAKHAPSAGAAGAECFAAIPAGLVAQANDAALTHAQATAPLTAHQQASILAFETSLFTAQVIDDAAGSLSVAGGRGGPRQLAGQDFYFGVNDALSGDYRSHHPFDARGFSLYAAWDRPAGYHRAPADDRRAVADRDAARAAVARGERLFDGKPIAISGVKGLNDALGIAVVRGTCTTCHDAPNAGNHSVPLLVDLGLTDASRRSPDLPLYTLRNRASGETVQTSDPGRALITGRWKDVARFKPPVLHGLAGRAPYFHNGSAVDLNDVVDFYNTRFGIGFSADEISDLVAFLRTL